jgi:hypothetical protein
MARIEAGATLPDQLDRDAAAVVASIVRLARNMALRRSRSPQRKILIIGILARFGAEARVTAERALLEVLTSEKDPVVRQHAGAARADPGGHAEACPSGSTDRRGRGLAGGETGPARIGRRRRFSAGRRPG